jgi:hypothetical protein
MFAALPQRSDYPTLSASEKCSLADKVKLRIPLRSRCGFAWEVIGNLDSFRVGNVLIDFRLEGSTSALVYVDPNGSGSSDDSGHDRSAFDAAPVCVGRSQPVRTAQQLGLFDKTCPVVPHSIPLGRLIGTATNGWREFRNCYKTNGVVRVLRPTLLVLATWRCLVITSWLATAENLSKWISVGLPRAPMLQRQICVAERLACLWLMAGSEHGRYASN